MRRCSQCQSPWIIAPLAQAIRFAALCSLPLAAASPLNAQEATEPNTTAASNAPMLEEMIVTSERHVMKLLDAPVSTHVVSGEYIDDNNILNMSELSQNVPNLVIGEGAIHTNIYMRGVGSGVNRSFEQSVGMYIDDVYMGRGRQYRSPFLDIEQVEVLRGPQGVLYGKNTLAGSVVVRTARPKVGDDFSGRVSLDYESELDSREAMLMLTGSLTDSVAARFVHKSASNDGFLENSLTGETEPEIDESVTRFSLVAEPNNKWTLFGKLERSTQDVRGNTLQANALTPLDALAAYQVAILPSIDPDFETDVDGHKSQDHSGLVPRRDTETTNAVFNAVYERDTYELVYTLGYSNYEGSDDQDVDFSPITGAQVEEFNDFTQWSNELRFVNIDGQGFDYQAGLFWLESDYDADFREDLYVDQIAPVLNGLFQLGGIDPTLIPPTSGSRATDFQQDTSVYAVFGEASWSLTDTVRLTLGGRYSRETKEVDRVSLSTASRSWTEPLSLPGLVTLNALGLNVVVPEYKDERTENSFTPSVKLLWSVSDDTNLYAKYETGVKSGGFNSNSDGTPLDQEYEEENADAYEVGIKTYAFDRQVQLNAALFYSQIEDLQVTSLNGLNFLVGNAAESVSKGLEADFRWQASDQLMVSGYYSYLDSYFSDYSDGPCPAAQIAQGITGCDLTDRTTPFAPETTMGVSFDYTHPINESMQVLTGLSFSYSSDYFVNFDLDETSHQQSFTKIDANIRLVGDNERWELGLIGKNLTDEKVYVYGLDMPLLNGGSVVYLGQPRTVAVRGTYRF